ncbi:Hypothetical predicted protein [Lecanosticta acicola]|uniref:Transglycosylase SLT domain-containing protein n=1 Tax=Lecanosticta acicola TaxID=111012 RepID=A0AAI9E8E6_9PEZI|nr:Hypothetical predicted protein [Lecanosticta acicola]
MASSPDCPLRDRPISANDIASNSDSDCPLQNRLTSSNDMASNSDCPPQDCLTPAHDMVSNSDYPLQDRLISANDMTSSSDCPLQERLTSASGMSSNSACLLLGLPAELRNRIYELVIEEEAPDGHCVSTTCHTISLPYSAQGWGTQDENTLQGSAGDHRREDNQQDRSFEIPEPHSNRKNRNHVHRTAITITMLGECTPAGWTSGMNAQFEGMMTQEMAALRNENLGESAAHTVENDYKQANINIPVSSAFSPEDPWEIMLNCPLAQKANDRQRENYPKYGSMDLTAEDIADVYGPAIAAATKESGVPGDILRDMIWTESKGHPLTSNGGLVQIDPVAWGTTVQANSCLTGANRYTPWFNIMAGALYLKSQGSCSDDACWETLYKNHYQDPTAACRAAGTC